MEHEPTCSTRPSREPRGEVLLCDEPHVVVDIAVFDVGVVVDVVIAVVVIVAHVVIVKVFDVVVDAVVVVVVDAVVQLRPGTRVGSQERASAVQKVKPRPSPLPTPA